MGGHAVFVEEAEVPADIDDDVGDGAVEQIVLDLRCVDAFAQLIVEGARGAAGGVSVDGVLDGAEDALAGGGALLGGGGGVLPGRLIQPAGEGDAAADGAGDAVEGGGVVDGGMAVICGGLGGVVFGDMVVAKPIVSD